MWLIALPMAVSIYLGINNIYLRQLLNKFEDRKILDLEAILKKERQAIINDIEEKYKADMVSFEALSKRMQLEKQKTKELEERLRKVKEKDSGGG